MKKVVSLGVILMMVLTLGACGNKKTEESASSKGDLKVLKLGVMPSNDNIPLIVATQQGFDEKYGFKLELETFNSARDRDTAFQAGKVDGINTDLVAVALYLQGGMDVKVTGSTYGQFDLLTNDDGVTSVKDLAGKDVLLAKNNGPEYAFVEILKAYGMEESEVNLIDLPQVPTRLEMLRNNKATAAIVPEPFTTMGKADGMTILDSTRDVGINPFVMCFTTATIDEKAEEIQSMYKAYNDAVDWLQNNDKEAYIDLFIEEIGFPVALKEQIEVPNYPKASQATAEDVTLAFNWAQEKGLLKYKIESEDVLSNVYFK